MKLLGRLILIFAALAVLPLLLMGGFWVTVQRQRLMADARRQIELMTAGAAAQIDLAMGRAVEQVRQLAAFLGEDPELVAAGRFYDGMDEEAVEARLLDFDRQWLTAPDDAGLVRRPLSNRTAQALRRFQAVAPDRYAEILVTDRAGALFAATNRTTDFYQADEEWWRGALAGGAGAVRVGDPLFDESAQTVSLDVAAPIYDGRGGLLGIVKVSHDVDSLLRAVNMDGCC